VHALELWPGRGGSAAGRLRLRAIGERRSAEVERASRQAQRLRWDALAAITAYAAEEGCRRRTILRHFGDPAPPAPIGRCCDVCDPPDDLTVLAEDEAPARSRRRSGSARPPAERAEGPLADALRAFRQARARQDAVPAFVVFSDATLAALCEARPADAAALAGVPGFGPVKVERYGPDIVRIVAEQALQQAG
jgi:superfamily II DNA helicase RecQ